MARTPPSAPVKVGTFTAGQGAHTTASFTPSASALLLAYEWFDSGPSIAADITFTDSLSGSWTEILLENFTDGEPGGFKWSYQTTGVSPAARTVTATHSSGAGVDHGGWVYELTSVDLASPIGAVAGFRGDATGADPRTAAVTTLFDHSRVLGGVSNYNTGTFSAGAATTLLDSSSVAGFSSGAAMRASTVTDVPGSVTLSVNRSPTQDVWHTGAFEVKGVADTAGYARLITQLGGYY